MEMKWHAALASRKIHIDIRPKKGTENGFRKSLYGEKELFRPFDKKHSSAWWQGVFMPLVKSFVLVEDQEDAQ